MSLFPNKNPKNASIDKLIAEKVSLLEKLIGKKIRKNKPLFITAITHSSFSGENKEFNSNERLEFIGDSVLSLSITHFIFENFKELSEGDLSKKRAYIVSEKSLSEKASQLNIGNIMLFGKGESKSGGQYKKAIIADALESIIAAIFLSCGFEEAEKFVVRIFKKELIQLKNIEATDYKTRLQEIVQKNVHKVPEYKIIFEEGNQSSKTFIAEVRVNGKKIGEGKGSTKKEAEEAAAMEALKSEYINKFEEAPVKK
ncbi:MAG: ribonuclease III [Caldisericaceae bacterium]